MRELNFQTYSTFLDYVKTFGNVKKRQIVWNIIKHNNSQFVIKSYNKNLFGKQNKSKDKN